MTLYARPYDPFSGSPLKNMLILDAMTAEPRLLPFPIADSRALWGEILTSPGHITFEVWKDEDVVGMIWLTRVVPTVDATLNFHFFDRDLVGKRKLLQNFCRYCLTPLPDGLQLHRLTMEVPEGARIERFARKVLDFQLEGESRPRNPELPKSLTDNFVARQGSRREQCRWDGTGWVDVVMLRLLASELGV
jgi:hypothetical protein